MEYDKIYIDGEWIDPSSAARITVCNASTGEVVGSVPEATNADIDRAIAAARCAFDDPQGWSRWEPSRRADALRRLTDELQARSDELARRISVQNGVPITLVQMGEIPFATNAPRYYARLAEADPAEEVRAGIMGTERVVRRVPYGVVAALVPWNAPQVLSATKYAPALATGNTVVLKVSPDTVLDAYLFAEAVAAAGLPPGVVNVVAAGADASAYLVTHPDVDKVAFTGSTAVGRQIATAAGQLLRPVTLELGGKSAAIMLDDADLDLATVGQQLFLSTLLNNGQTCFVSTRILAPASTYETVVDAFAGLAGSLAIGDALDPSTMVGPLVNERHRERVEGFIRQGVAEGARLIVGGARPPDAAAGWFVEPTVFADVDNDSAIAQEEIFGPVLSIIPYDDVDDAVRLANDSRYGLAGTVWSSDPVRAEAVAGRIRTGSVGINGFLPDVAMPFGGFKESGVGREGGLEGLHDYQLVQAIYRQ